MIRIEILDWMTQVYDLSGLNLIVYALIYSECELTTKKIAQLLNVDSETIKTICNELRGEGLIQGSYIPAQDVRDYMIADVEKNRVYTWTVDEDLLI